MKALKVIVPIVIVLAGISIAVLFFVLRPRAEREPPAVVAPSVEVAVLEDDASDRAVRVTGTVLPARSAAITAEVSGRVIFVGETIERGGRIKKGEVMFRVDSRDYVVAVEQARAQVEQAALQLKLEESRAEVAVKEWKLLGKTGDNALALRRPQVANAKAQLAGAEAGLKRAELSLGRTTVRAPWDAIVRTENLEVGMIAGPGAQLAQIVGTEEAWVLCQVPMAAAKTLRFADSDENPSVASVRYRAGTDVLSSFEGVALRLLGEVDRETRTAQVLIRVTEPFKGPDLPLLPDAFVEVELAGASLDGAVKVPRRSVTRGDRVFIVDGETKLSARTLDVIWRDREWLWSISGVAAGEKVLLTALPYASEGLRVQILERSGQ